MNDSWKKTSDEIPPEGKLVLGYWENQDRFEIVKKILGMDEMLKREGVSSHDGSDLTERYGHLTWSDQDHLSFRELAPSHWRELPDKPVNPAKGIFAK